MIYTIKTPNGVLMDFKKEPIIVNEFFVRQMKNQLTKDVEFIPILDEVEIPDKRLETLRSYYD